jgi:hypothetical protein
MQTDTKSGFQLQTQSGHFLQMTWRFASLVADGAYSDIVVHLHPVAHCYFTSTFLFRLCAAY